MNSGFKFKLGDKFDENYPDKDTVFTANLQMSNGIVDIYDITWTDKDGVNQRTTYSGEQAQFAVKHGFWKLVD